MILRWLRTRDRCWVTDHPIWSHRGRTLCPFHRDAGFFPTADGKTIEEMEIQFASDDQSGEEKPDPAGDEPGTGPPVIGGTATGHDKRQGDTSDDHHDGARRDDQAPPIDPVARSGARGSHVRPIPTDRG